MNCIDIYTRDPFFNLAAEEYLMKQSGEEFFMIYVNEPSVVVGKHQNAYAEMNLPFILEQGLNPARRISGGGAVYHDSGNLNFSFITNEQEGDFINFRKYTRPVIDALGKLGLKATLGRRNEILLGGHKISGTASHVFKNRVLHHGTLLFDADRTALSAALKVHPERYADKSVQSVRSVITNIRDHLQLDMDMDGFCRHVFSYVCSSFPDTMPYHYSERDVLAIRTLSDDKYSTPDWKFGYSPKYAFSNAFETALGPVSVALRVNKGRIEEAEITVKGARKAELEEKVCGKMHEPAELIKVLDGWGYSTVLQNLF